MEEKERIKTGWREKSSHYVSSMEGSVNLSGHSYDASCDERAKPFYCPSVTGCSSFLQKGDRTLRVVAFFS